MLTPRNLIAAATVGLIYALPVPSAHAQAAPKTNLTIEASPRYGRSRSAAMLHG